MLEGNESPKGEADEPVNTGEAKEDELKAQDSTKAQSSEVNERLLNESKKYKSLYQQTKQELDKQQKAKLEEQNRFKELYEQEQSKYQALYKNLVKEKIKAKVTEHATKAGCVNVEDLLRLGNVELLQVDEESLEVYGAETFVEDTKKQKPYLFNASKPQAINPATPGGVQTQKRLTAQEIAKLPQDQKNKIWAELLK